jgi:hypothetical protein
MTFEWPVPEGWGHETIPFPLPFAPELPFHGTEELRFMPGWATPGKPDHWAYLFAWWLESAVPPRKTELEATLVPYYAGLCAAVAGPSSTYDPDGFRVALRTAEAGSRAGHPVERFDGTADLFDAFAGGEALTLNLRIETRACPIARRAVVLIEACPTFDGATWNRLEAQAAAFACH